MRIVEKFNEMINNPTCELNYLDDFSLLISIMLSAQTTDKKVNEITPLLFLNFPKIDFINEEDYEKIEMIIRPLGLSKTKTKNIIGIAKIIKEEFNSKIPKDYDLLCTLPGIGNKSAKVFLVEFYKENYFPVDTHVKRVSIRLGIAKEKDDVKKVEMKLNKFFKGEDLAKLHQQFVLHGRYRCLSRNPKCEDCLLKQDCKYYKKDYLAK